MNKIISYFKGIGYIILYFLLSILTYIIFYKYVYNNNVNISNYATMFCDLLVLLILILIFRKKIIPDYYSFKKKYITNNICYYILGLIAMIISSTLIMNYTNINATNQELNIAMIMDCPLPACISVLIAGISEEIVFRGLLKKEINNKYVFIITSGLIFGFLHIISDLTLPNMLYIIPYSSLGIVFAKMYYDTDNIWTSIFFHMMHNFITVILILGGL